MRLGKIDAVAEKIIGAWIDQRRAMHTEALLARPILHEATKDAEHRARLDELKELEEHLTVGVSND